MAASKPVKVDEVEGLASALPEAGRRRVVTIVRCRACGRLLAVPWGGNDEEAITAEGWQRLSLRPQFASEWLCRRHVAMIESDISAVSIGREETRT